MKPPKPVKLSAAQQLSSACSEAPVLQELLLLSLVQVRKRTYFIVWQEISKVAEAFAGEPAVLLESPLAVRDCSLKNVSIGRYW